MCFDMRDKLERSGDDESEGVRYHMDQELRCGYLHFMAVQRDTK